MFSVGTLVGGTLDGGAAAGAVLVAGALVAGGLELGVEPLTPVAGAAALLPVTAVAVVPTLPPPFVTVVAVG